LVQTRVLCAGPPGSGRDNYLEALRKLAKRRKKSLQYYHLFNFIAKEAKLKGYSINKLNVLDFFLNNPEKMLDFRMNAVKRVSDEMKNNDQVHIVSTPYFFEWKGESLTGLTEEEVRILDPKIFVIIIDDVVRVKEELGKDPEWAGHKFTLSEIAKWRREEIKGIFNFAHSFVPPRESYIIAREHDVEVLFDLVFNRKKKKIYLSYPITGVDAKTIKEERAIAQELSEYFVIFDPLTIHDWAIVARWKSIADRGPVKAEGFDCTIEYTEGKKTFSCNSSEVEYAIKDIRRQIVDRDYRLIDSSDYVFVYHPRESISAGVMCEMMHAKIEGKMVYAMYPFEPSPFFEHYANRIFKNRKEFLEFVKGLS